MCGVEDIVVVLISALRRAVYAVAVGGDTWTRIVTCSREIIRKPGALAHRFLLLLIVFRGGTSASYSADAIFVFLFGFTELNLKTSWEFFPVFNFLAFCRRPPAESSPDAAISVRPRPGSRPAKDAAGEGLVDTLEVEAECRFRHHLQSLKTSPILVPAIRLFVNSRTYAPEYSSSYRYLDYQSHRERDKRLKLRKTPIRAQSEVRTPGEHDRMVRFLRKHFGTVHT